MSYGKLPELKTVKSWMRQLASINGIPEQVKDTWDHSTVIWHFADRIARLAISNGYKVDRKFLKVACYIHDIGKMVTGGWASKHLRPEIFHIYEGFYFLHNKGYQNLARVCLSHLCGVGSSKKLNKKFGFENKAYYAESIEEKIVAYVDARTDPKKGVGPYVWPIERPLRQFRKFPGVVPRLKTQHSFILKITNNQIV